MLYQSQLAYSDVHPDLTPDITPFSMGSYLAGIAGWVPEKIVTTEELQRKLPFYYRLFKKIDIGELTGIRERRFCEKGQDIMYASLAAVENLRTKVDFDNSEIDLVIFAGITRDFVEPATAVMIAKRLGIQKAIAFDVSNACLGFVDAMMIADAMIAGNRCRNALIVSAEVGGSNCSRNAIKAIRRGGSFYKNFASLTLGDGAAAALLRPTQNQNHRNKLIAGIRCSFPEFSDACTVKSHRVDKLKMQTDPRRLFKAALRNIPAMHKELSEVCNWNVGDVDVLVAHQASEKILYQGAIGAKIPIENTINTLSKYGNMATVSIPFTIAKALESGKISAGKNVFIAGFGSGLGIGMMALKG